MMNIKVNPELRDEALQRTVNRFGRNLKGTFQFFKKEESMDIKIMFRRDLPVVPCSILKMDNFHLKYESDEQPHLMINMKGEEIPLGSKSIVRSWERKFKNASLKIIGEHVYVHKMFKSVQVELWWGLEMDCPFIWDLRKDLGLTSERYVPHITLLTRRLEDC